MGIVTGTILLRNARVPTMALQVGALADTRTVHLCIPEKIRERLQLEQLAEREVVLADGTKKVVPYVGPVEIRFKNRVVLRRRAGDRRPGAARLDPDGGHGPDRHAARRDRLDVQKP